jgi:hypothetical protein
MYTHSNTEVQTAGWELLQDAYLGPLLQRCRFDGGTKTFKRSMELCTKPYQFMTDAEIFTLSIVRKVFTNRIYHTYKHVHIYAHSRTHIIIHTIEHIQTHTHTHTVLHSNKPCYTHSHAWPEDPVPSRRPHVTSSCVSFVRPDMTRSRKRSLQSSNKA